MSGDHHSFSRLMPGFNLALIFLVGFFLFHSRVSDFDLWWHLAAGRWIIEHRAVPLLDPFSFTSAGNDWIDLHWLFQLLVYGCFRLAGAEGLILLPTIFFSATLWLVLRYGHQARFGAAAILGGLSFLLVGQFNFVTRPNLLTLFFLALTLFLLDLHCRRRSLEVYWLAPLLVLWVNCHSMFISGLALIAAWGLGEFLDALRSGRLRQDGPYLIRLAAASALAAAVCLLNPYQVDGFLFPLELYSRISGKVALFSQGVTEFAPPFSIPVWVGPVFFFKISLLLVFFALALRGRKVRAAELLAALLFGFLAFKAVRNLGMWSVVSGAILGRNLGQGWQELSRRWPRRARGLSIIIQAALGLTLLAHLAIFGLPGLRHRFYGPSQFGMGLLPGQFPERAVDFMAEHPVHGQGFNCFEDGGYLIWRLFPPKQVFFDGRLEVHDQIMSAVYQTALRSPRHFSVILNRFHLDYALLRHDAAGPIEGLARDPEWAPVYLDDVALLLVRRIPEHAKLISRYQVDLSRLGLADAQSRVSSGGFAAERMENLAGFFLQVGRMDLARALFERAAAFGPGQTRAELFLGLSALNRGELGEAKTRLLAALPGSAGNRAEVHARLAEIAEKEAAFAEAIEHWKKALDLEPNNCDWRERLGLDYLQQNLPDSGAKELETSLQCAAPAGVRARRWGGLAVALAAEGKLNEAEIAARSALDLDPDLKAAERLLKDILKQKK